MNHVIADRGFLRRLAASEALPVGICTGVMVLSAAGLAKGRNATTHAGAKADLAAQGATVINARVVDDGDLITGGGITSGLDVALWLVERFVGAELGAAGGDGTGVRAARDGVAAGVSLGTPMRSVNCPSASRVRDPHGVGPRARGRRPGVAARWSVGRGPSGPGHFASCIRSDPTGTRS
ncbi:DJ-1/PfpI family protein [Streptomyces sp. NPDC051217]|uniref:DJ-1/PfpI family protein n=1 Tax=Streptomyces sp. NPDC051217 TaxID=3365644 RepID=UPI0037AA256A